MRVLGENVLRDAVVARAGATTVPFVLHDGPNSAVIGEGDPVFEIAVRNTRGRDALLSFRELTIAEAYIRGDIDFTGDFVAAMSMRDILVDRRLGLTLWSWALPLLVGRRRCNEAWIAKHYDSDNIQLIGADRTYQTYTPGIYENDDASLEAGAERKLEAAFTALRLAPGATMLEIGCGWGGFLRYCAAHGVTAEGITLSRNQLQYARERLHAEGLTAEVRFQDFFSFEPGRRFDAISLMGSLEDLSDYRVVMDRVASWLAPHGRVYLDFASATVRLGMSTFITKHVWPGRFRLVYLPALFRAVGHSGLEVVEMHNDRHNYELWARKFRDRWVASTEQVSKAADDPTWRTHHLLQAGVAASMDDSTDTASAYRLVLAHRCPQRPPPSSLGRRLYRAVRTPR